MQKIKILLLKPWVWSVIILFTLLIWLATGDHSSKKDNTLERKHREEKTFSVRYSKSISEEFFGGLYLYGETKPNKAVDLKSEVSDNVLEINGRRGDFVEQGELIVKLDEGGRRVSMSEAEAFLNLKQRDYEVAVSLCERGFKEKNYMLVAEAELEKAKANFIRAEINLQNTEIRAPFRGVISEKFVECGDYVAVGTPLISFIDNDPLKVEVYVSQNEIDKVYNGQNADVRLSTKENLKGLVSIIAPEADNQTRTFAVEIEIPNLERSLLVGVSAEVKLLLPSVQAHHFSAQYLCLDENEDVGVKVIGDENNVVFYPVDIIDVDDDGVWVSGLPEKVDIITVGHFFVKPGDIVEPVKEQ